MCGCKENKEENPTNTMEKEVKQLNKAVESLKFDPVFAQSKPSASSNHSEYPLGGMDYVPDFTQFNQKIENFLIDTSLQPAPKGVDFFVYADGSSGEYNESLELQLETEIKKLSDEKQAAIDKIESNKQIDINEPVTKCDSITKRGKTDRAWRSQYNDCYQRQTKGINDRAAQNANLQKRIDVIDKLLADKTTQLANFKKIKTENIKQVDTAVNVEVKQRLIESEDTKKLVLYGVLGVTLLIGGIIVFKKLKGGKTPKV